METKTKQKIEATIGERWTAELIKHEIELLKFCPSGICFYCEADIKASIILFKNHTAVITGCPICNRSFVE